MTQVPENYKKLALARLDIIKNWMEFRKSYKNKMQADCDFIQLYNSGEQYKYLFEQTGKISRGGIHRWNQRLNNTDDWTQLIPSHKYSKSSEYRTSLNDDEIKVFMNLLLHPNKISIGKAISLTKYSLRNQGYVPADITFRRYAKWFRDNNYDKWILARDGEKGLKDKVEPYIVRDASVLEVGEILVADGHKLNFQVINPFTGRPTRATIVGFLDWKSTALVGYEIMLEENTQCIASALRRAILNLDIIPKIVYQDNGKAFRAKYFTADKGFNELGFNGLYGKLGIKSVFAMPYNARAKVIERFFKEFSESFEQLLPSYIGNNIDNKPAHLKRNEKFHKNNHNEYIPKIEEVIKMLEAWQSFKNSQICSNEPDKTIAEVLESRKRHKINKDELDDLMLAQEIKTIQRNGIRFLNADYFNEELYGLKGKCIIKYSLFDLSSVKIFSIKGEFLCVADRVTATHPMAQHLGDINDLEDYKQKIQKQRKLRRKTLNEIKNYLPQEEVKFIETQMEQEKPLKAVIPIKKLEKKYFKNSYERFEFLKNKSELTNQEQEWIISYQKSNEYKLMYGE